MSRPDAYQVANPDLVFDTIEGEVIILDIRTGTYYQLTRNAVPVWNWLVGGVPVPEIISRFLQHYPIEQSAIESGISAFVKELSDENLLQPRSPDAPIVTDTPAEPMSVTDRTFTAPALLKYTDMQSLLLLDPIHDADTPGWPQTRTGNAM